MKKLISVIILFFLLVISIIIVLKIVCGDASNTVEVTINFDDNGGILENAAPITVAVGTHILDSVNDVKGHKIDGTNHYILGGWHLNYANGTLIDHTSTIEANIILFAKWVEADNFAVDVYISSSADGRIEVIAPEELNLYHGTPLLDFLNILIEVKIIDYRFQGFMLSFRRKDDQNAQLIEIMPSTRMPEYDITIVLTPIHTHRRVTARVVHSECILGLDSNIIGENSSLITKFYDYVLLDNHDFFKLESELRYIIENSITDGFEDYFNLIFTNDLNSLNSLDVIITVTITLNPEIDTFEIAINLNEMGVTGITGDTSILIVGFGTTSEKLQEMLDARNITSMSHELTGWTGIPTTVTEDITVYAKWIIRTFIVTINLNEGQTINGQAVTRAILLGEELTFNSPFGTNLVCHFARLTPTSESHMFVNWLNLVTSLDEDITVVANWGALRTFDLTINAGIEALNVVTGVTTQLEGITFGTTAVEVLALLGNITPTSDNLVFGSWLFTENVASDNTVVTIIWDGATVFTVTVDLNEGQMINGQAVTRAILLGEELTFNLPFGTNLFSHFAGLTPTSESHIFANWLSLVTSLDEDITVVANWGALRTFTLTVDLNTNGITGATASQMTFANVPFGTDVAVLIASLTVTSDSHKFERFEHPTTVIENTTVRVVWGALKTFIITFNVGPGATTIAEIQGVEFKSLILDAISGVTTARHGHAFSHWMLDNIRVTEESTILMSIELTAVWNFVTVLGDAHDLFRDTIGNLNLNMSMTADYIYELVIDIITNETNYDVEHFTINITIWPNAIWITIYQKTFTIYFDTGFESIIIPEITNVVIGTYIIEAVANITNLTRFGYKFVGWLLNEEELTNQTIRTDVILKANWAELYVSIQVNIYIMDVINEFHEIEIRHGMSGIDASNLIYDKFVNRTYDSRTHIFRDFIVMGQVTLSSLEFVLEDKIVISVVDRHSAIISFDSTLGDLINGYLILEVGINLFQELYNRGILILDDVVIDGRTFVFRHWYYSSSFGTGIVDEHKTVPYSDPNLVAIFTLVEEEKIIVIYSDIEIFNGENFLILTKLDNNLDIRDLLLELRNAMNGLAGNTTRYFQGITFNLTPGYELVGFYKFDNRGVNILHTNEILSFGGSNQLSLYAIVRDYTERSRLTFTIIDAQTVAITGSTSGALFGRLALPSFHNGRKVVSIGAAVFSSRGVREVILPVYIRTIANNAFANNQALRYLHLTGLPHLEFIADNAFVHAGWLSPAVRRHIYIDAMTPLTDIQIGAFNGTDNIDVYMVGNWQPSQPPAWWSVRVSFNAANRFFDSSGTNMTNFFD